MPETQAMDSVISNIGQQTSNLEQNSVNNQSLNVDSKKTLDVNALVNSFLSDFEDFDEDAAEATLEANMVDDDSDSDDSSSVDDEDYFENFDFRDSDEEVDDLDDFFS